MVASGTKHTILIYLTTIQQTLEGHAFTGSYQTEK